MENIVYDFLKDASVKKLEQLRKMIFDLNDDAFIGILTSLDEIIWLESRA